MSPGSFRKNPPQFPFLRGEDIGILYLIEKSRFWTLVFTGMTENVV